MRAGAVSVSVRMTRRHGEVALLFLTLFLLLRTRAQYNGPWDDFEDYDESEYDFVEDEDMEEEEDYQEKDVDANASTQAKEGEPPRCCLQNKTFTPMCNNENCWIRVDWEPPPRDTWMSCLLSYRVGFRKHGDREFTWITDEMTYINGVSPGVTIIGDMDSDEPFFFDEAEGTNHSLTIPNLDFETNYEVVVAVLNPFGRRPREEAHEVSTPPGSCIKVTSYHKFQLKSCRAMLGWVRA